MFLFDVGFLHNVSLGFLRTAVATANSWDQPGVLTMSASGPGAEHAYTKTIERYYHGCNTCDVDLMMSCVTPQVVHYFTHYKPVRGARALAEFWAHIGPKHGNRFSVDHAVVQGDEAVVEWTLELTMDPSAGRELIRGAEWYVFVGPEHATAFADAGFDRADVSRFLFEKARLPMARFRRAFDVTQYAEWEDALSDDEEKPIMRSPDLIHVLVVGGAGKHSSVMPSWGMTASVTRPILP